MQIENAEGLSLLFDDDERETAGVVRGACVGTRRVLHERWGLDAPVDCRVYVMTSWRRFLFHAAPWPWRLYLGLTYPLWARRVERIWDVAGGWAQSFGDRHTAGIKPARLMQRADRRPGQRIFHEVAEDDAKVRHVTCHELTHAFSAHLRLPHWLKEGLAMVAVDRLMGKATVRAETLEIYTGGFANREPGRRSGRGRLDQDALVALYVRGYWTTRYLDEEHPELLTRLLARRYTRPELDSLLASSLGMKPRTLWGEIDARVSVHYASP